MFVLLLGQEQHQCQDPGATVLPRAWDFSQELRTYSEFKTTQAPGSWWTSPKALLSAWRGFFLLLPSPSLLCSHYQLTTFFFFSCSSKSKERESDWSSWPVKSLFEQRFCRTYNLAVLESRVYYSSVCRGEEKSLQGHQDNHSTGRKLNRSYECSK